MPIEAEMLDRLFELCAAMTNAGLGLEQVAIAEGVEHLMHGRRSVVMGEIERMRPRDPLSRLRLVGIVRQIGSQPLERPAGGQEPNDHGKHRFRRARMSRSSGFRSSGGGSPGWWRRRTG